MAREFVLLKGGVTREQRECVEALAKHLNSKVRRSKFRPQPVNLSLALRIIIQHYIDCKRAEARAAMKGAR